MTDDEAMMKTADMIVKRQKARPPLISVNPMAQSQSNNRRHCVVIISQRKTIDSQVHAKEGLLEPKTHHFEIPNEFQQRNDRQITTKNSGD